MTLVRVLFIMFFVPMVAQAAPDMNGYGYDENNREMLNDPSGISPYGRCPYGIEECSGYAVDGHSIRPSAPGLWAPNPEGPNPNPPV